jgi:hypothetical protein
LTGNTDSVSFGARGAFERHSSAPCCSEALMSDTNLDPWSKEQLLAELRHRERRRGAGGATRSGGGGLGLDPDLRSVPTSRLASALMDRQRVVYGTDDRQDLFAVKNKKVLAVSNAVVALVKAADLEERADGAFDLATTSYAAEFDLCGNEPFVSQPLGCFCTGFLVGPDVVATAGHCVKSAADLATLRFVFGFRMKDAQTANTSFAAEDVYEGKEIIGRQMVGDGPDWALVRLKRTVVGRVPVTVRTKGKIANRQSVFVIGHPNGLPAKYAPKAKVRDNTPGPFFVANLDTYGGNSGSPVFGASSYRVEGILVRGENDFVSNGSCNVSLVCPTTGCRGEDVTRSTVWAGKVPKVSAFRTRKAAKGRASKRG